MNPNTPIAEMSRNEFFDYITNRINEVAKNLHDSPQSRMVTVSRLLGFVQGRLVTTDWEVPEDFYLKAENAAYYGKLMI